MPFPPEQRQALLGCRGVGPTVVDRLEQMGFASLDRLAEAQVPDLLRAGAALTGSTCWSNSPQTRAAIGAAVALAREARHA